MYTSISPIIDLLVNFSVVFTAPTFNKFINLALGWIVCTGRHSISRVIQFFPDGLTRNHCPFYRFFSRDKWEPDDLTLQLLPLVLSFIPDFMTVFISIDDTLCYRSGAHIWGAGMHFDQLRSSYGKKAKKRTRVMAFGHSWVISSLLVPLPWSLSGFIAIPVAFRLYRSKKTCPEKDYKKRTELAVEMLDFILRLIPLSRRIMVLGDDEYACKPVLACVLAHKEADPHIGEPWGVSRQIDLCGPITMKAAFYQPLPSPSAKRKRGRPRRKGDRLPSPRQLAEDDSKPWETSTVSIYGRQVKILHKSQVGWRYNITGTRLLRMVVTRDPAGRIEDRAYFSTDATMTEEEIIICYSRRWAQEVQHRNLKQFFGVDDPQNGWWRHPKGERRDQQRPGAAAHETRGQDAVRRTVPFILTLYAVVVLWYLRHGNPTEDVARVLMRAPWNNRKGEVCFADMLSAARRELLRPILFGEPQESRGFDENAMRLLELLIAA